MEKMLMILLSTITISFAWGSDLEKKAEANKVYLKNLLKNSKPYVTDTSLDLFSLIDIYGNHINILGTENGLKLEGLENRIIFLNLVSLNIPAGIKSISNLVHLQEKYKDKIVVITINVNQSNQNKEFLDTLYKIGLNHIAVNYSLASEKFITYIFTRIGSGGHPCLVVTDGKGEVQFAELGAFPYDVYESIVQKLLKD